MRRARQNARITTSFEQSKSLGIVLINGEFANGGVGDGCATAIPYKWLLSDVRPPGEGRPINTAKQRPLFALSSRTGARRSWP